MSYNCSSIDINMIVECIVVFISQLLFSLSRNISNRAVIKERVSLSVILTGVIQSLWLVGTFIGVQGMMNSNYIVISSYLLGGMLGTYLNFKIKV